MGFLWFVAIISFIFGILFLFFPKALVKLSALANQVLVYTDEKLFTIRIGLGICLLFLSTTCFFLIYYYAVR